MKDMKILIFGGSGFIGTRLCSRLKSMNRFFHIYDILKSVTFPSICINGDIVKKIRTDNYISYDCVINLAAEHRDDVKPISRYYDVNVLGAKNICNYCRDHGINKLIFTSSVAVYGFSNNETDELGEIKPFNDYGKSKYEAEKVLKAWQSEVPELRTLVVIRPTVVFGEGNRGNVYNLFRQIALGKFMMIGLGENKKSMAYVENVAAFIEKSLDLGPGIHHFNYVDKPDFTMNALVETIEDSLGIKKFFRLRLPFKVGLGIGYLFDLLSILTQKKFPISSIRVRKFCSDSVYCSNNSIAEFRAPVKIRDAIRNTIQYEFNNQQ